MTSRENRCNSALLIMRLMLGLTLVFSHGLRTVVDQESWQKIGLAMEGSGSALRRSSGASWRARASSLSACCSSSAWPSGRPSP